MLSAEAPSIPQTQTAALVHELGGKVVQSRLSCPKAWNQRTTCITKTSAFRSVACWVQSTLQYYLTMWILASKGPVFCARVTAYKAVLNANIKKGQYMVALGAGGGLGHFAVRYSLTLGAKTKDVVSDVLALTGIDADVVIVTSGNAKAYAQAAEMLQMGGSLSCVGIPPGKTLLQTPVAGIVIKGLHITGSLVGSLKEGMEAIEYVQKGIVKPQVEIRKFRELPQIYV